ncbi:hypothetical protein MGL_4281 [Malassezia globosa CBS 7966]|uniref:Sodium/calcium exchanger membrane region domain-containing protein n=1 Tax=Malassezia globosa (strain ATCC MYA-4612 / CBS 7966) TaxID=425265 RepID=A8QES1_MALGO|nr:uncharacterized protein MGL_4281 [Malassezia globosa CBS 7966]EDP41366.1 hypothetical protein MGL_4281 [Malassezia globosa CBS 7966]
MFVLWLLVLFSVLGLVASDFFCPNLSSIAAKWGMSDSIVGVTLLALGNGFPDVVSTFRAMDKDAGTMAMGEIMGAAVFTVAIVCGSIMVFYSFDIPPVAFVRDVGTYMLASLYEGHQHIQKAADDGMIKSTSLISSLLNPKNFAFSNHIFRCAASQESVNCNNDGDSEYCGHKGRTEYDHLWIYGQGKVPRSPN